jgi:autotransporter-associated beta strand protein
MNVGIGTWTIESNSLTIGAAQELVVNPVTNQITISSEIRDNANGASALVKTGAGTLTLTGTNSYTGPSTVNSGVLDVGTIGNGSLGTGGLHLIGGSILQGNGSFSRTLGNNFTPAPGQIAGGNGGFAARGGALTVDFGGTLALSGTPFSNRFGDNLIFGSPSADSPVVVVNPINLNGSNRNITVNPGLGGDSAELAGVVGQSTGSFGIVKNGAGRLILSAVNTYTGTTTLNGGVLDVGLLDGVNPSAAVDLYLTTEPSSKATVSSPAQRVVEPLRARFSLPASMAASRPKAARSPSTSAEKPRNSHSARAAYGLEPTWSSDPPPPIVPSSSSTTPSAWVEPAGSLP